MKVTIQQQTNPGYGCIPTCAISILKSLGLQAPTEAQMVDDMWTTWPTGRSASGFERLAESLRTRGVACQVKIQSGSLTQVLSSAGKIPLMIALSNSNGPAHCGIATDIDFGDRTVMWRDPNGATTQTKTFDWLEMCWTKEGATLQPIQQNE